MRIIGIDPGLRKTGYGIIEVQANHYRFVDCGCIETKQTTIAIRIQTIFTQLTEIIEQHQPSVASVEQVFMHVNPDSALKLGQARGASICALTVKNIQVYEYSAKQIKNTIVGTGQAQKKQVQFMVSRLLNISGDLQEDAADALAGALCHGFQRGTRLLKHSS